MEGGLVFVPRLATMVSWSATLVFAVSSCLILGCGSDDLDPSPGSTQPGVDAGQDAALDTTADQEIDKADVDIPEAPDGIDVVEDVLIDTGEDVAPDGPTGGVVLEEYEEVCARINGCLAVIGQGECMRRAYIYGLVDTEELRFYYAMQSLSFGPGIPPGTIYFPDVVSCADQATSCDEIYDCLGAAGACNASSTYPYCNADKLHNCVNVGGTQGVMVLSDCSAQGLSCFTSPNGVPSSCALSFCDSQSYAATCVGSVAYNCVGAGVVEKDCSLLYPGTKCSVFDDSGYLVAQCQGDGEPCGGGFKSTCEGTNVKVCQDGFEYERQCPPGLPCGIDPMTNIASCGAMVTAGCAPETCNGSELTYCLDGQPRTFDCTALGFSSCLSDDVFKQARCSL